MTATKQAVLRELPETPATPQQVSELEEIEGVEAVDFEIRLLEEDVTILAIATESVAIGFRYFKDGWRESASQEIDSSVEEALRSVLAVT